jgi:putative transposase
LGLKLKSLEFDGGVMLKAFKTKLKVTEKDYPKQHAYLMKIAKACVWVRNWYIREALDRMKADGVTIFTPKKELKKYSPRELRKVLTALINSDPDFAWLKGIPSTPRSLKFEDIEKTYTGGKGVKYNFISQCEFKAKQIEEKIEKLKKECQEEGREPSEEEIQKLRVFFGKGKKPHEIDDLYAIKGFPRFEPPQRHLSFRIDNIILDNKNKCIQFPLAAGNKKFGIPKLEGEKIFYYDHGLNPEGIDDSAIYTISYDGEFWWMTVKQKAVEIPASSQGNKDEVLGIDLGIKTTAYISNGQKIEDIKEVWLNLERRKKYLDALRHRNLEKSPKEKIETPWGKKVKPKSAKYKKLSKHIQNIDNKIIKIKDTVFKQQVASIKLEGVKGIVFEDFNINSLKKNDKWSSKVQKICIGKIRELIINKAESLGIKVMKAPRNFPSTQICSHCGKRNLHMQKNLKERTFVCEFCGYTIDRDLNASKNLANLWGSPELTPWKE